jgi:hypothetical protein
MRGESGGHDSGHVKNEEKFASVLQPLQHPQYFHTRINLKYYD